MKVSFDEKDKMRLRNISTSAISLALTWPAYMYLLLLATVPSSSLQSVRLAGSPANVTGINEGRIEVYDDGKWKDICHRKWDRRDAGVVCRQIGFSGAAFGMVESYYGPGRNNGSVQNFDCEGDETALEQCSFKSGDKTCKEHETAGVSCFLPGYLGCFLDRSVGSVLSADSFSSEDMTVRKCLQYCYDKKHRYAGVRRNTDCHCAANGTAYDSWGSVSNTNCQLRCAGNQAEACGGSTTWFWTTSIYDVDLARCHGPMEPSFAYVKETGAFWFGSTTTFDCYTGFQLVEDNTLKCVLGDEVNELVWQGEPSSCEEIPDPTSRNKQDEWERIQAHAYMLKGTKGTIRLAQISSTRLIIGALVAFLICFVIAITIIIVCRKERKLNRSPKIRKQEEGHGNATGYQLANGPAAVATDTKI